MVTYTKKAVHVFAPVSANGVPRAIEPGEVQTWGTEVERTTETIAALFGLSTQWKRPVRAASTANVTATIAAGSTFGGVTVATGDRIAFLGQSSPAANGVFVVQASGAPVRSSDADAAGELSGMAVYVSAGTEGGRSYLCTATGTISVGVTALPFVMISDQVALNGAIATIQAIGLAGADPATWEGVAYQFFGPGRSAALTSQGFWHNLVDKVAPRGEIVTDVTIDGITYALALTDNTGQILAGITKGGEAEGGRLIAPGLIELIGSDDTHAGGLVYKDGTAVMLARKDGGRAYVRGWMASSGLPTLCHVVYLGQSNAAGADGQPRVTTTDQGMGAVMFARGYNTWGDFVLTIPEIENRGRAAFNLIPHREQDYLATGETYASGLTAQFKAARAGGRFAAANLAQQAPLMLHSYPHRGGRSMYELGPDGGYGHQEVALDDIRQARRQADAMGIDYGVIAMVYNQGEAESGGQMVPGGPFLGYDALRAAWKAQLADYYGKWDTEFRLRSGQGGVSGRRIPMFIIQTVATWTGQAQREVARDYREMFLATPQYFVPSGLNGEWSFISPATGLTEQGRGDAVHSAADGYRWLGEMVGKVQRRVLLEGEDWRPLEMIDAARETDTQIRIRFSVPRPPLRWSSDFDIGIPDHPTKGFRVKLGTPNAPGLGRAITRVQIYDPDIVILTLDAATPLAAGSAVYIEYGDDSLVRETSVVIDAIRAGAAYANGQASTEIVFAGDIRAQMTDMMVEGAFFLKSSNGAFQAVMDVRFEAGKTVARGESRAHSGDLTIGEKAQVHRDRRFGNLVDSDTAASLYDFGDPRYGTRQGRPYPLNNWCCIGHQTVRT